MNTINTLLTNADKMCDYIPFVSTLTNLVDLFEKQVISNFVSKSTVVKNRYCQHLQDKSHLRIFMLFIPIVGNIVVATYDLATRKYRNKKAMLEAVSQNGQDLQYASKELKRDKEIVLAAIGHDPIAFRMASDKMKNDKDVVLAAVNKNPTALKYAGPKMKNNEDVVLAAVNINGSALEYAGDKMKNRKNIVYAAVQTFPAAYQYASDEVKNKTKTWKSRLLQ